MSVVFALVDPAFTHLNGNVLQGKGGVGRRIATSGCRLCALLVDRIRKQLLYAFMKNVYRGDGEIGGGRRGLFRE